MAVRIKAACVAVTLTMGLLGATTATRADQFGIYGGGSEKNDKLGIGKGAHPGRCSLARGGHSARLPRRRRHGGLHQTQAWRQGRGARRRGLTAETEAAR